MPRFVDPSELRRAFVLMVAFNQTDLVAFTLEHKSHLIDSATLQSSLESAAATNNLQLFIKLYDLIRERMDAHQISKQEFTEMLEKALYWAAVRKNEAIVYFILERAFIFGYASELPLARVGRQVFRILTLNNSLMTYEYEHEAASFERIYESLATVLRMRCAGGRQGMHAFLEMLESLTPQLPLEILVFILSLVLHQHTTVYSG